MLNLNGLKFARNKSELTDNTYGYYTPLKHGIKLMDDTKEPIMFIATHEHSPFLVTCHKFNGRIRYMYALSSLHEKLIGFDELGYMAQNDAVKAAVQSINSRMA